MIVKKIIKKHFFFHCFSAETQKRPCTSDDHSLDIQKKKQKTGEKNGDYLNINVLREKKYI